MNGTEIRSMLLAAGLRIDCDGDQVIVRCLKSYRPDHRITALRAPGWHNQPNMPGDFFICPDGETLGAPEGVSVELTTDVRLSGHVARGGTIEGWKDAAAAAIQAENVPHFTLGILAGFSGPIISLAGLDTCGVNLSGMSSSGKSTAQRLAASAWSTPDPRKPGLFQSARATDNAIESLAYRSTGTVLSLDELAHVTGKSAATIIYTLAGGVSKSRMGSDLSVRRNYAWRTFVLLSGECSLAEKIKGDGGEWLAGMAARIPDVDVTDVNRKLDRNILQRIDLIDQNYGHAGPAFVKGMIAIGAHRKSRELREHILAQARVLAGDGADSATIRAAQPFAILKEAGALAMQFDLIPSNSDIDGAIAWAWERFRQSSDAIALDPEAQAFGNIRTWIAERWGVTIKPLEIEGGINNRETLAWYDEDTIYIPRPRLRDAAESTLKETAVAKALSEQGLLTRTQDSYRHHIRYVPKIGRVDCYALRRSEFGRMGPERSGYDFNDCERGAH